MQGQQGPSVSAVLAQTIINEAPEPWAEIALAVIPAVAVVVGMLLQQRLERRRTRDARRHTDYAAVLSTFRRAAVESGKAIQALSRYQANPGLEVDVPSFVRVAWDAGDTFGEAVDRAAIVASRRAREAAVPLVAMVGKLRSYPPLSDVSTEPTPSLDELETQTSAVRAGYEEAIAMDLGTLTLARTSDSAVAAAQPAAEAPMTLKPPPTSGAGVNPGDWSATACCTTRS
jgi:hypothetical protein